jgi:beta-galactosidase GanA
MKRLIGSLLLIFFAVNCPAQTSQPTLPDRYQSFLFGVDYYPEQWPETMWEDDARRMRECGVGAVRIGEFAWALMEPREGTFDFSLFDRVIAALAKHNLKIIFGTPTATPPKWLTQKYPEVLYVFADRQPANDQTIPIMSLKDLFGLEVDSYQVLRENNSLKFTDGTSMPMLALAESLKPKNAGVVATWERGDLQGVPAVTENRFGQGKAVYYGSFFNLDAARYLLSRYAKEQKLSPLFADLPREIEVTRRSKGTRHYYFILNHKNEAATAHIGGGFYDLLESKEAHASVTLPPFGYKILRKEATDANSRARETSRWDRLRLRIGQ